MYLIEERRAVAAGGINGPAEKGLQGSSDVSRGLLLPDDRILEVYDWICTRTGNEHQRHSTVFRNRLDAKANRR